MYCLGEFHYACCIPQVLIAIDCEPDAKTIENKVKKTAVSTGKASLYVHYPYSKCMVYIMYLIYLIIRGPCSTVLHVFSWEN